MKGRFYFFSFALFHTTTLTLTRVPWFCLKLREAAVFSTLLLRGELGICFSAASSMKLYVQLPGTCADRRCCSELQSLLWAQVLLLLRAVSAADWAQRKHFPSRCKRMEDWPPDLLWTSLSVHLHSVWLFPFQILSVDEQLHFSI